MLGAPYTDIRIERCYLPWEYIEALQPFAINLHPPASGPEIELVFATAEGCKPADEDFLRHEVERIIARPVLACRRRDS